MRFILENSVSVSIHAHPEDGDIGFDLISQNPQHPGVSSHATSFFQNVTIEDAKAIRKALKAAIKEIENG